MKEEGWWFINSLPHFLLNVTSSHVTINIATVLQHRSSATPPLQKAAGDFAALGCSSWLVPWNKALS